MDTPCEKASDNKLKKLHYFPFWFSALIVVAAGILNFSFLTHTHYRVHADPSYISFCAVSDSINCNSVAESPYSIAFGVPVSVWGLIGYLFTLSLLFYVRRLDSTKAVIWSVLMWIAAVFSCCSLYFTYLSLFHIQSLCILCIIAYGTSFWLFFTAWMVRKRLRAAFQFCGIRNTLRDQARLKKLLWAVAAIFMFVSVMVSLTYPPYWNQIKVSKKTTASKGFTGQGNPYIGASQPVLEIIVYSDYLCAQCRRMNFHLRRLVEMHPDAIRLVHRHYPMDHAVNPSVYEPYHVGSGALALLAIHAAQHDRFWEMNDALYEATEAGSRIDITALTIRVGLDNRLLLTKLREPSLSAKLAADIEAGRALGINGTPAFYIEGQIFLGAIPEKVIRHYLRKIALEKSP